MTHTAMQHVHNPDPPRPVLAAPTSPWALDGIVERLRTLWGKRSGTEIANALSLEFNISITRNAVISKLDRLGLLSKRPRGNPEQIAARKRARYDAYNAKRRAERTERIEIHPRIPSAPIAPTHMAPNPPLNLSLADLPNNGCRFIPGDDLLYCGHDQRHGSNYCEFHHGIVWVKPLLRGRAVR